MLNNVVFEYEKQMEHHKWNKEIPFITFPANWEIKISPPFCGAVVRFRVKLSDAEVSVYLDCYGNLGAVNEPYWEVFPHNDDVFRCVMNDTDALINAISESLNKQLGL